METIINAIKAIYVGNRINKKNIADHLGITVYKLNKMLNGANLEDLSLQAFKELREEKKKVVETPQELPLNEETKEETVELPLNEEIELDFNTFDSNDTVYAPENAKYLSEFITELPTGCLFDKGAVGCGGTTLAIKSKDSYVIAAPFVSMIDNKCASNPEIFGVKEGVGIDDIISYLRKVDTIKIMVTYDSLYKVVEALGSRCKEVRLLVDELHILFTAYSYRSEAIKRVLRDYKKFKSFCFMTATPLDKDFMLTELKYIPVNRVIWPGREITTVKTIKCSDVFSAVCNIIRTHEAPYNLYFFVNSVEFINKVAKTLDLTDETARMICSKSQTKTKLKISDTTSEPKTFNFITSTAFEGSDIMDTDGMTIIVSDPAKSQTLLDIQTSIPQIAGRIRNTKYYREIYHLYTQTRYSDVTAEEFKASSKKEEENARLILSKLDAVVAAGVKEWINQYINKDENGDWFVDSNLINYDIWTFNTLKNYQLCGNLKKEYEAKGFNCVQIERIYPKIKAVVDSSEMSFIDIVKKLRDLDNNIVEGIDPNYYYHEEFKDSAFKKYDFLQEAIKVLGWNKIASLKYSQVEIKKAIVVASDRTINNKVIKLFKMQGFTTGQFVTLAEVKANIDAIYKQCGITKTAKATDITEFFDVKRSNRRIEGKQTEGFTIIRSRIIV
jgi:hypothetical protein